MPEDEKLPDHYWVLLARIERLEEGYDELVDALRRRRGTRHPPEADVVTDVFVVE